MQMNSFWWIISSLICSLFLAGTIAENPPERSDFPSDFVFGVSTSSYQVEGAVKEGGRGPSIWDSFTHDHPEKIDDRSNGDFSADSYHQYKEDVRMVTEVGLNAYRFSLSWSRILPRGHLKGGVNKEGIKYYNNLINDLVLHGIEPFVTLFHWDVPQALEEEYGGFLSSKIVDDFRDYSDICFKEFGDRVKYWITINEPLTVAADGYDLGIKAPGRCSVGLGDCREGNSAIEPYQVAHNFILAHANAVQLYRNNYKEVQNGEIGMSASCRWLLPLTNSTEDQEAAIRELDFTLGWFVEPLVRGDYPITMREYVGERLPKFTQEQSDIVRGSYDFIGLNYYTSRYASNIPHLLPTPPIRYSLDAYVSKSYERNGLPIGPKAASSWLYVYPQGLKELLVYVNKRYDNPIIYITENGVDEYNNHTISLKQCLNDTWRVDYHRWHMPSILEALREGVRVKGYIIWSLLDNFEWENGYTVRFGVYYVDFLDNAKRYPKYSAYWLSSFLGGKIPNPKYNRHDLKNFITHDTM
ncbi:hypothetical protein AMTRI_Chr13g82600 [Amborella trichopoda]